MLNLAQDFLHTAFDTWPVSAERTAGHGCKPEFGQPPKSLLTTRYSFILEGLLTFLCALTAWWMVPDFPEDATFLNEREKKQWLARLRRSQGLTGTSIPFTWEQVTRAFKDWRSYCYALTYVPLVACTVTAVC